MSKPMILAFGEPNKTWQSIEDLESLTGGHRATVEDGNLGAALERYLFYAGVDNPTFTLEYDEDDLAELRRQALEMLAAWLGVSE